MPIPVTVVANLEDRRLPEPMEASVYFFVSESLANVVKHARATHAEVKLCIEGEDWSWTCATTASAARRRRAAPAWRASRIASPRWTAISS